MTKRHELTDEQWELLGSLVPRKAAHTGRPPKDPRVMLNGILWILATGAPWRDLPERFGSCKTVHRYFSEWRRTGVFSAIIEALQMKLDDKGRIDWELWCVDGANVRAARAAAGADKKVSSATRTNRRTTHWAAAEAGLDRNSMWLLTARALRWPSKSRQAKCTNRPAPSRSSARLSHVASVGVANDATGGTGPRSSRATKGIACNACATGFVRTASSRSFRTRTMRPRDATRQFASTAKPTVAVRWSSSASAG